MPPSSFPFLSLLIALPIAAGALLFLLKRDRWIRIAALSAAVLELLISLALLTQFQSANGEMQFAERYEWIPTLNMQYYLGVDGLSVLFLPLTALLTACVIGASWTIIHTLPKLYFALLLWLESATLGVFCALDMGLFFMFWELTLPPIYFLVSLWGTGPQRRQAATKYTLMMLAGSIPLLMGIVLLALNNADETSVAVPAGLSFDFLNLLETAMPIEVQSMVFALLFIGFAVKAPLFPFHVWLPTLAMEGPVGVAALLTGLKLGLFGIIRFAVPLAPQATQQYAGLLAALGAIGALYGALLALKQTNLRRMLAYSSISHVGLVLIGIASLNIQGIQGAVFQLLNFALVAGGLFLTAGFLNQRLGSTDQSTLGGAAQTLPILASLLFILGLCSLGIPGTNGFAAEHLIIIGAISSQLGVGMAALVAAILGAAYLLGFFSNAFFGPVIRREISGASDLRPRETLIASILVTLALMAGVSPQTVLDFPQKSLQIWLSRVQTGQAQNLAIRN
jgi:NADH-quinone oxidoreductase subunit M